MSIQNIIRATCDGCGIIVDEAGAGRAAPKGWAYVTVSRHRGPGSRAVEACLCQKCIRPLLEVAKLKIPSLGGAAKKGPKKR